MLTYSCISNICELCRCYVGPCCTQGCLAHHDLNDLKKKFMLGQDRDAARRHQLCRYFWRHHVLLTIMLRAQLSILSRLSSSSWHQGHFWAAVANTSSSQLQPSATAAACSHSYASSAYKLPEYHATTILCVRKGDQVVLVGDGQVSVGNMVAKPNAKKIRRIGDDVVVGFAGSAADGLSLLERLETKLEEHPGQLLRAAVELAKLWRQDKALRFLQAELLVADPTTTLTISGNGDVFEPHDGVMGIGSGSPFAVAAARALMDVPGMDAKTIAHKAMKIAGDMCVYTNTNFMTETVTASDSK